MTKARTLALNAERLIDLTPGEMAGVNGAASWGVLGCIGVSPTLTTCLLEKTYGHSLCHCGTEYCV